MRWSVGWVGDQAKAHRGKAIHNTKVAIGMTVLEPGHTNPAEALPASRLYLVIGGEAITDIGAGVTVLGHLDGLHVKRGETAALRNNGPHPLRLLWVDALPLDR